MRMAVVFTSRPALRRRGWEIERSRSEVYAGFKKAKELLVSVRLMGRETVAVPPVRRGMVTPGSMDWTRCWALEREEAVGASVSCQRARVVKAASKRDSSISTDCLAMVGLTRATWRSRLC